MRFFGVVLLCLISSNALSMTYVDHIESYYKPLVKELQGYGLRGPISLELAQFALLRQIHEDGIDRSADRSLNGMVPGGINQRVMDRLDWSFHKLSRVTANDGQGCYCIRGPRANIQGALAIALWYDEIISTWPSVDDRERALWERSKVNSYLQTTPFTESEYVLTFLGNEPARLALLTKVNNWYGPQGRHIDQLRKKLRAAFIKALE